MLTYPQINPIAIQLGPLGVHWYGLMYLVGFAACWILMRIRIKKSFFTPEQLSDLVFYGSLGAIVGGRLGYMLFYHFKDKLGLSVLNFVLKSFSKHCFCEVTF